MRNIAKTPGKQLESDKMWLNKFDVKYGENNTWGLIKRVLSTELRAEIDRLHQMHATNSPEDNRNALTEIQLLREKLMESQRLLVESTRNWQEKFALSERRKLEEAENLKLHDHSR
ncbi:hypothetical protein AC249_AIPGENE4923 [Exaiptasia diaphana]|nr:hypothetical protein AC249_AIPGENE4923 [Exaiptasia diaphana]